MFNIQNCLAHNRDAFDFYVTFLWTHTWFNLITLCPGCRSHHMQCAGTALAIPRCHWPIVCDNHVMTIDATLTHLISMTNDELNVFFKWQHSYDEVATATIKGHHLQSGTADQNYTTHIQYNAATASQTKHTLISTQRRTADNSTLFLACALIWSMHTSKIS